MEDVHSHERNWDVTVWIVQGLLQAGKQGRGGVDRHGALPRGVVGGLDERLRNHFQ